MTAQPDTFTQHRSLLFAVAYRMIGMVADAEDLVQETFLRWQRALDEGEVIASPKSWLTAVITRLCIDHLRSARVRREEYVGPWLPEPLPDDDIRSFFVGERLADVAQVPVAHPFDPDGTAAEDEVWTSRVGPAFAHEGRQDVQERLFCSAERSGLFATGHHECPVIQYTSTGH